MLLRRGLGRFVMSAAIVGLVFSGTGQAQSDQANEYDVKAAFLFNFTKFVEWPDRAFDGPGAPIVMGVVGDSPFGDSLTRITAGQKVQGRDIVIRNSRRGDDLRRCQVIFVSAGERAHWTQMVTNLQSANVLTVSDMDDFAESGGVIQFVTQEQRVRFIVNLDAATRNGLHLSAKLLALAQVIGRSQGAR